MEGFVKRMSITDPRHDNFVSLLNEKGPEEMNQDF
jgi:hypothetical protein